ncbi:MAG TPA: carbamate kinase [Candidatus Limnocylindrales bacterium]|nr:carbamate kinase [Candidatus Limnocylindrales bacterium]
MSGRIVAALGGNALIRRGQPGSMEVQRANLRAAARALADVARSGADLVVTHGNGPQVGYLALEAEAARSIVDPPPLDVLVAESQGQIGYLVVQALEAELEERGDPRPVVAVLTRTLVSPRDRAFARPTKPVGPTYDAATARTLAAANGWAVARDGAHWRRVVASPMPLAIQEAGPIRSIVDAGAIVVASGGGGIPVAHARRGLMGVEAVVDKDLAAVELAIAVDAGTLLLLTDVNGVHPSSDDLSGEPLTALTLEEADAGLTEGRFPAGSMGPKVQAAASFVRRTGGRAFIGRLDEAAAILTGDAGTRIGREADLRSLSAMGGRRPAILTGNGKGR